MAKKVDVSFMKFCYNDDEWTREVKEPVGVLLGAPAPSTIRRRPDTLTSQPVKMPTPPVVVVVDMYSKVWGPCEMLAGHYQNFFFDYGEKLSIRFIRAERDKVRVAAGGQSGGVSGSKRKWRGRSGSA